MHKKIEQHRVGSLVVSAANPALASAVSRAVKTGELIPVVSNIYALAEHGTDRLAIVQQNLWQILAILFPGALISHRSALEFKPFEQTVVLTYSYRKKYTKIPGLTVQLVEGSGPIMGEDRPFAGHLFVSGLPRAWLENVGRNHQRGFPLRLGQGAIAERIEQTLSIQGHEKVAGIVEKAEALAPDLGYDAEAKTLRKMWKSLAGKSDHVNPVPTSKAWRRRRFDHAVVARMETLHRTLLQSVLKSHPLPEGWDRTALSNLAFIDAYFSNYIEGTKFEVSEAEDIIFNERVPAKRPDGHDVLGTYQVLFQALRERSAPPLSLDGFFRYIKRVHHEIMHANQDVNPGAFKERSNYAGTHQFVLPELVEGTIEQGLLFLPSLPEGIARALYLKFLLAEIHPFLDGNGRVSRAVMNQELVSCHEMPIVIPSVYRIDYMGGVKAMTKRTNANAYIRVMMRAHEFTSTVPFEDYKKMMIYLKERNAFSDDPGDILRF